MSSRVQVDGTGVMVVKGQGEAGEGGPLAGPRAAWGPREKGSSDGGRRRC